MIYETDYAFSGFKHTEELSLKSNFIQQFSIEYLESPFTLKTIVKAMYAFIDTLFKI